MRRQSSYSEDSSICLLRSHSGWKGIWFNLHFVRARTWESIVEIIMEFCQYFEPRLKAVVNNPSAFAALVVQNRFARNTCIITYFGCCIYNDANTNRACCKQFIYVLNPYANADWFHCTANLCKCLWQGKGYLWLTAGPPGPSTCLRLKTKKFDALFVQPVPIHKASQGMFEIVRMLLNLARSSGDWTFIYMFLCGDQGWHQMILLWYIMILISKALLHSS